MQIVKENVSLSSEYSFTVASNYVSLIIGGVHWKHTGVYTCIVVGGSDMIQAESSLNVLSKLYHENAPRHSISYNVIIMILQYPLIYTFKEAVMLLKNWILLVLCVMSQPTPLQISHG
jgi:hypothetical protein